MKTPIRAAALLLITALLAGMCSAADPVVTRSYLTQVYQPYILTEAGRITDEAFDALEKELSTTFSTQGLRTQLGVSAWLHALGDAQVLNAGEHTFDAFCVVSGSLGTRFTLRTGSAQVLASAGAVLTDVTDGLDCADGAWLTTGHCYMITDTGGVGIRVNASGTVLSVSTGAVCFGKSSTTAPVTPITPVTPNTPVTPQIPDTQDPSGYVRKYLRYAQALQEMGLFRGTNAGFELTREATRVEALVMLIRLLGEEEQALACTGKHPFTDVPSWADAYVAYGYDKGYTNGLSKTVFGASQSVTAQQYLTFLLRALGYSDAAGDFVWSQADAKAEQTGLITAAERAELNRIFYRDQVAFVSYKALMTPKKGSTQRLLDVLMDSGAVARDAAYRATVIVG